MRVYESIIGCIFQGKLCGWCVREMRREVNESAEKKHTQIIDNEENGVAKVMG